MLKTLVCMSTLREPVSAPRVEFWANVTDPPSPEFMSSVEFCSAEALPMASVPAVLRVVPEWLFAPERVSVPFPVFVRLPVVAAAAPAMVRLLVSTWIVAVWPALIVNARSVETSAPVYWSVPPSNMRLPAAVPDWPMELADPPLARPSTERMPAVIVVAPE